MNDKSILELARLRLHEKIGQGISLSHPYILKEHPAKNWVQGVWNEETKQMEQKRATFNYCPDCKGFAWGLKGECQTKYKKLFEEELINLKRELGIE